MVAFGDCVDGTVACAELVDVVALLPGCVDRSVCKNDCIAWLVDEAVPLFVELGAVAPAAFVLEAGLAVVCEHTLLNSHEF
jgi:hypothetical protein